jgi:predicted SprT family Zn-dependent metalloprotease
MTPLPEKVAHLTLVESLENGEIGLYRCDCGRTEKRSRVTMVISKSRGTESACSRCRKKMRGMKMSRNWPGITGRNT